MEAHGKSGGPVFIVDFQLCGVRFGQTNFELMEANSLQIDPKKIQQLDKIDSVDDAQAVELLNAWHWPGGLYLAEPRIGNIELRITLGRCNLPAEFFDLTRGNPEMPADRLKSFSGVQLSIA